MTPKIINASMYTPNFSYTYPGKLNEELLIAPTIQTPALSEFATIKQGIRCGEYMNLMQPLTRVLTKGSATCSPTYTTAGEITDRKLDTGLFEINLSWCKKDFQAVCNVLGDSALIGDGLDGYELGNSLRTKIFEMVLEQNRQDIWKVILFGDNSLGSGSTNVFSTIDGIWTKFMDAFGSYCVKPISNAFPNLHNSVLVADQARDILRLMWGNSDILLKQLTDKKFFVTGSVWENYYDSVLNNCCVEGSWKAGQDGLGKLYYRGIELVPLWIADQTLENDTDNPFYDEIRHFAILTTPKNHMIGVEKAADLNNLEMCYDCRTKETLIQGEMRFGYNFQFCKLQSVAY